MADGGVGARGRFITFEGGDGAGKSEQVRRLAATLKTRGIAASITREPGGSTGAEEIRALLVTGGTERWDAMSEALLFCAARRDHWLRRIKPELEQGTWIISDRFADSTLVYQGHGGGVPLEKLHRLHALALNGVTPDLTLLLDLPAEIGLARSAARSAGTGADRRKRTPSPLTLFKHSGNLDAATGIAEQRFEEMSMDFHRRIRDGFRRLAEDEPERFVVLDASQDIDKVAAAVFAAVRDRLGKDLAL